jgi:hypothetical protein
MPEAIASWIGTPSRTKRGVRMLAPPKPVSDPKRPTRIDISSSVIISIKDASPSGEVKIQHYLTAYFKEKILILNPMMFCTEEV